jgi:hypothetical protein
VPATHVSTSPQRQRDLWFASILLLFVVPLAFAVIFDAALTWDGAYLLFWTLDTGEPFVGNDRLLDAPIHRPVLWVNSLTDSMRVLRATFGVVHVITPLISLGLSWWVVRRVAPALIIPSPCSTSSQSSQATGARFMASQVARMGHCE